ncbi:MAG: type II toxin-antitoxin system VapC family toxin [Acidobacteriaceae bacterium]
MNGDAGILLDTHTWLWLANGDERLPVSVRKVLEQFEGTGQLFVAAISLLEIANMERRKCVVLPLALQDWLERALSEANIGLIAISPRIAAETAFLPEGFHGDPADRLIAATVRVENLTLCTHDQQLVRHGKRGVFRTLAF